MPAGYAGGPAQLRVEVRPRWPFQLPGGGADGLLRRRGGLVERLLHIDDRAVVVRVAQPGPDRVLFGAWTPWPTVAEEAVGRMRVALGVDDDLRQFHERFRWDPLIGRLLRATPSLRVSRRPDAFEALAWAICEQLIDYGRALSIQRRIVAVLGRRCGVSGLQDSPDPARVARGGSARLEACDLSGGRARALVRVAREMTAGRLELDAVAPEEGWRRLRTIPGIGAWTVEMLALHGQARFDQVPAGDLGLLKAVGRARTGDPRARATPEEVRELFARYEPYGGLAASYVLRAGASSLPAARARGVRSPDPAGTRWSERRRRRAAC